MHYALHFHTALLSPGKIQLAKRFLYYILYSFFNIITHFLKLFLNYSLSHQEPMQLPRITMYLFFNSM